MTIKETYDYLLQIRRLDGKIRLAIQQYEALKSQLLPSGIRSDLDKIQTTPEDRFSELEAITIDLEKNIKELRQQKQKAIVEVTRTIYRLKDDEAETVLLMYYVGRKPIEDIADAMNYSVRSVYYIKRRAIHSIAQMTK